jgi:enamine deaminase RidA (YjgF/YER057c/UK114 family)
MAKRRVLKDGLPQHRNPIPTAVKIGQMVFSSAIGGHDPETNKSPKEPDRQVELAFENIRRVMKAAGGSTDDIAKVTVFLKDMKHRELVNREWLKMFPDEENRPVRHAIKVDLPGELVVQLEIVAVL